MLSSCEPGSRGPWRLRCDARSLPVNAEVVDSLARLVLVARRHGCELRLTEPTPELLELIEFMGLAEVLRQDD